MNRRWRRNKQRRERYRQQQEALSPRVRAEIRQVNRSAAKRYREEVHKRTRAWYVELQRTRARNLQLRRRAKAVSRQLRDLMLQVTDSAATLLPLVQRLKQAPGKQHRDHHQQQQAVPEHTSQQQQQPTTATASRSEVDNIDDDDNSDNEDDALVPKGMEGTGQHRLARVLAAADAAANLDTGSADDSSSPGSDDGDDGDDDDDDTGDEGGDGVTLTRGSSAMGFPSATSPLAGIGADRQTAKSAKAVHLLHRNGHACAAGSSPTRGHPASLNPSSSPTSSAVTPAGHQSRAFAVPLQAQLPCAPPSTVIRAHQSYLQPFAMCAPLTSASMQPASQQQQPQQQQQQQPPSQVQPQQQLLSFPNGHTQYPSSIVPWQVPGWAPPQQQHMQPMQPMPPLVPPMHQQYPHPHHQQQQQQTFLLHQQPPLSALWPSSIAAAPAALALAAGAWWRAPHQPSPAPGTGTGMGMGSQSQAFSNMPPSMGSAAHVPPTGAPTPLPHPFNPATYTSSIGSSNDAPPA